jgi:hypothetical protein
MDSGSWADWVNAAGTYLAVASAVFAAVVALRSYRIQRAATDKQLAQYAEDERLRLDRERRDQASKVAIWAFLGRYHWLVHGVNASGLPTFRLTVLVGSDDPSFSVAIERGTQGPGGPDRVRKLGNALEYVLAEHSALDMDPDNLRLEITFTDTWGVRWHRDHVGLLHEVSNDFDFVDAPERLVDRDVPIRDENVYYNRVSPIERLLGTLGRWT